MFNELANISYGLMTSLALGVVMIGYMDHADALADALVNKIESWLTRREFPLRVSWQSALSQMDAEFVANRGEPMTE